MQQIQLALERFVSVAFFALTMDGYWKLGRLMASTPTLTILRRFRVLNIQNILFMQAEINELEQELMDIARDDRYSGQPERERFGREWWRLARARGGDSVQWQRWIAVREKLNQYSAECLYFEPLKRLIKLIRFGAACCQECAEHG